MRSNPPLFCALLLVAAPVAAQPADVTLRKLSPAGSAGTDVESASSHWNTSPDGNWVVFWADAEVDGVPDLYSVSRYGGAPRRLTVNRPAGGLGLANQSFLVTADSRRVVFLLDQETPGRRELWSVPIQGPSAAVTKLSPSQPADFSVGGWKLFGDGLSVAFYFRSGTEEELWAVPADGSSTAHRLHAPGIAGSEILDWGVWGDYVLYAADHLSLARYDLFRAHRAEPEASIRLNGDLVNGGDVSDYRLSGDSTRAVYLADQRFDGVTELFSVPIDGPPGASTRLSPTLVSGGDVLQMNLSADGSRAIFLADATVNDQFALYSAPIGGTASAATRLNGDLVAGGDVELGASSYGDWVAYVADALVDDRFEAFLVPLEGPSTAAVRVNPDPVEGGDVQTVEAFAVAGQDFVRYAGDMREDNRLDWFLAPLDLASAPHPLFGPEPHAGNQVPCQTSSPDRSHAYLCLDLDETGRDGLWSIEFSLGGVPERLDAGSAQSGADVTQVAASPANEWVYFRADRAIDERHDLHRVPATGGAPELLHPVPLSAAMDVLANSVLRVTPDGQAVLYLADHATDEKVELWIADRVLFASDFERGDTMVWSATMP
jgi:hypothetical protein